MTLTIERLLGQVLKREAKARTNATNPDYNKFRSLIKKNQTSYKITSDEYIEVSPFSHFDKGLNFPHYNWGESLSRLEGALDESWHVDDDGYVGE